MRWPISRPQHPRRGVTLVEMLVVLALLVLMMTIIVQVFQAATGSVTAAKVYQELDDQLREIDATIRQDLQGATAQFTPPLDPDDNLGYFEYIENSWADAQGEDTDDCLRFTAQAPPGQPFVGRMWLFPPQAPSGATAALLAQSQPVLISSEYAEIIYFLRNGNLYRRVLLIAPDRQTAVNYVFLQSGGLTNVLNGQAATFSTALFNGTLNGAGAGGTDLVSWQAVNDLSAHPAARGLAAAPVLNTLGSLTNRENRAFTPRFSDDYNGPLNAPDGLADDYNTNSGGTIVGDGVPDYYPTLYPNLFNGTISSVTGFNLINSYNHPLSNSTPGIGFLAFPFIFPGAYSKVDPNALSTGQGWIHVPDPTQGSQGQAGTAYNHAPIDLGDSLPIPTSSNQFQTWWGFPTWRDTISPNWLDPVKQLNRSMSTFSGLSISSSSQALGLQPWPASGNPGAGGQPTSANFLPGANLWFNPPLFNDQAGTANGIGGTPSAFQGAYLTSGTSPQPVLSTWEDDLLMTGVRSFDVKALDNSVSSYVDLGNNPGNTTPFSNTLNLPISGTTYNLTAGFAGVVSNLGASYAQYLVSSTYSHEGVMPPRPADVRYDPQALALGIPIPLGDPNASTIRLRRTWDSWSTEYTEAPATGFDPSQASLPPYGLGLYPPNSPLNVAGSGTLLQSNPVYPSYPPPYPVPLRGLQIQIRVVDPRNERIKVITIRQDFSDKISNPQ